MAKNNKNANNAAAGTGTENGAQGAWDEKALSEMTREQLLEIAKEMGFDTSAANDVTKETIIAEILKAQTDDAAGSGEGTGTEDQAEGAENPPPSNESEAENTGGDKTSEEDNNTAGTQGEISVFSEERKGKTIVAVSGQPIVFDENGNAKVSEADALYLKQIPGFKIG